MQQLIAVATVHVFDLLESDMNREKREFECFRTLERDTKRAS